MTELLAKLLDQDWNVHRINTSYHTAAGRHKNTETSVRKVMHYVSLAGRLKQQLAQAPDSTVLWAGISPTQSGHLRDIMTVLPALKAHNRVFGVVHWGDFDRLFRSAITRRTGSNLVQHLTGFVFLDGLERKCADWIPEHKRFTISNTIDLPSRCSSEEVAEKRRNRLISRPLNVLFLSNMIPEKGYMDVLNAIRILRDRGVACHADFVGRWQSEARCKHFAKRVAEEQLTDIVTVHGGVSDRTVIKQFYLKADAFVLPTYYLIEAQPASILEAINAATPVITTRHAGIPIMLREEEGEALFVPPRDPEAIAEALLRLTQIDVWQAYSDTALRRFQSHFSPDAVKAKWDALLNT